MGATNLCVFIGRLGKDPDMAYSPSGVAVTKFSLAVDKFSTRNGEKHKETMWLNVVCFNKTAEFAAQYFVKGKPAIITGELSITEYQPKDPSQGKQKWIEVIASSVEFVPSDNTTRTTTVSEVPSYAPTPGDEKEF